MVDTLAGDSAPVLGPVMLLHHMRSSHGSLVLDVSNNALGLSYGHGILTIYEN